MKHPLLFLFRYEAAALENAVVRHPNVLYFFKVEQARAISQGVQRHNTDEFAVRVVAALDWIGVFSHDRRICDGYTCNSPIVRLFRQNRLSATKK